MTRTDALVVGGFIVAWIGVGAVAVAIVIGASAITRRRARRVIDARIMDALIDATREQHPRFPDWDTRELTDGHR